MRVANDRMVDLASNDYLGLATDARLAEAAREAIAKWGGTGTTSSRLVAGTTELHVELEHALAQLTGMDAALVFSSGYLANLGVTTALGGPGTLIVADEQCHASLIDGFRLSRSEVRNFRHNSVQDAADKLANRTQPRALISVESIYSVGGDAAPLSELLALAEGHDAMLLVDEAHSLGVSGSGSNTGWGGHRRNQVAGHPNVIVTATLSKALGSQGGGCAWLTVAQGAPGQPGQELRLRHRVGSPPGGSCRARGHWRHQGRAVACHGCPSQCSRTGYRTASCAGKARYRRRPFPRSSPVHSHASAEAALAAARAAHEAGVRVGCFRPPSVPDGGVSRLRLTARATLTSADIDQACATLRSILERTS